jgi:DNA mismatch repair ATPase MutS
MEIDTGDNDANNIDYRYTYQMVSGISKIKGGIKVLKDLEYPDEIISTMSETIKNIDF